MNSPRAVHVPSVKTFILSLPVELFHAPSVRGAGFYRRQLWDGVDEFDDVNLFIAGQFAVGKGKDIVRSNIVALANDDKAFGQFTGFVIGYANDRGVHDRRMLQEQRLQLGGGNAKALVLDHLFLAIHDISKAIGIHVADITRIEPAIAQGASRLLRSLPIALHDLGATNDELSVFSNRQFALTCLDIDDFLLGIVDGQPDAIQTYQSGI